MLALAILVLNHVTVIDVARGVALPDRAIEIEGARIRAVVASASYHPPAASVVHDLSGRYVLPGFIDMHAHVLFPPLDDDGRPLPWFDRDTSRALLRTLLLHGVTTVRDPGDATEAAVAVRGMLAHGEIVGPRLFTAGRILTLEPMRHAIYATTTDERQVREEVAWQAQAGVDFIKVYQDLPPALVRIAIDEAHRRGIRVIGHVQSTTWTEAARMGIDFIAHAAPWATEYLPPSARAAYRPSMFGRVYWLEHLDLDAPAVREMVAALVENHVSVDPTLIAFRTKFWGDDPRYTKPLRTATPPKHPHQLPRELSTMAARKLAEEFGGDRGAADWRHFGRLAGFTNRKPKYMTASGLFPFVRLIDAPGIAYPEGERFAGAITAQRKVDVRIREQHCSTPRLPTPKKSKSIEDFRSDPRYAGDATRVDLAFAIYALSHGSSGDQVAAALRSRDLSHKGDEKRQNQYVDRTITKALNVTESRCIR